MRRSLVHLALACALVTGCANQSSLVVYTPPPPVASAQSAAIATATPAPTPTVQPTPTPKLTPTPKPTLRPAALTFGKLSYEANACWDSEIMDLEGHASGGIAVHFGLTVKNTGQLKSDPFWITTHTTDWFDTNPWPAADNWKLAISAPHDPTTVELDGPAIGPGKSMTLKWTIYFITPFDTHYTVTTDLRDGGAPHVWQMWTHPTFCF